MAVVELQDHTKIAKELMSQWSDKPRVMGLVESFTRELNEIENLLFQLLEGRSIYTAVGIQLDVIGALFNEPRKGRLDVVYRSSILGKISQQHSDGTTESFLQSLRVISESDDVDFWEHYSGDVHAYMGKGVNFSTYGAVTNIVPAGVNVRIIFDDDKDGFVPTELLPSIYDLQTNMLEDIQTDKEEDIQISIAQTVSSDKAIPSEIQDSVLFNPSSDLVFSEIDASVGKIKLTPEGFLINDEQGYMLYQEYYFIK